MTGLEGEAEDTWVGLDLCPPEEEEAERRPHLSLQLPEKTKQSCQALLLGIDSMVGVAQSHRQRARVDIKNNFFTVRVVKLWRTA